MSAATTHHRPGQVEAPGFLHAVSSEWAKLSSQRAIKVTFAVAVLGAIVMTALVSAIIGATFDDWGPAQQADFDPIMYSLNGIIVSLIAFSVLGVMAVTPEYSSGMIRLTFSVSPWRGRVLVAKTLLVLLATAVGGVVTMLGMFLVGQAIFSAYGMDTASLGDSDAVRVVFGAGLIGPVFPLLALALGFLLRSTAGAITSVLVLLWAPEILGPLLPHWWQENVISLLPGPASDSIAISHLTDARWFSDPAVGAVITAAWLAGMLLLAFVMLQRRDA